MGYNSDFTIRHDVASEMNAFQRRLEAEFNEPLDDESPLRDSDGHGHIFQTRWYEWRSDLQTLRFTGVVERQGEESEDAERVQFTNGRIVAEWGAVRVWVKRHTSCDGHMHWIRADQTGQVKCDRCGRRSDEQLEADTCGAPIDGWMAERRGDHELDLADKSDWRNQ